MTNFHEIWQWKKAPEATAANICPVNHLPCLLIGRNAGLSGECWWLKRPIGEVRAENEQLMIHLRSLITVWVLTHTLTPTHLPDTHSASVWSENQTFIQELSFQVVGMRIFAHLWSLCWEMCLLCCYFSSVLACLCLFLQICFWCNRLFKLCVFGISVGVCFLMLWRYLFINTNSLIGICDL